MPLFSIITINYNNKVGLEKTLKSVMQQDLSDYEYIVIDGGSTDGSAEIVGQHAGKISYWVSEPDAGIYDAMNKGVKAAKGEYLVFLNSGDWFFYTDVLTRTAAAATKNPGKDIYYGDTCVTDEGQKKQWIKKEPADIGTEYFKVNTICHQAAFFKRELFESLGLHPINYKLASDYWFFLQSLVSGKSFCYLDFTVIYSSFGGLSYTQSDLYRQEHTAIWKSLVPEYVQRLTENNIRMQGDLSPRFVKMALLFNNKILKRIKNIFR